MALIAAGPGRRSGAGVLAALMLATLTAVTGLTIFTVQPGGAESAIVAMRGTAFVPASVKVEQVVGEPALPAAHGHAIWTNEDQVEHTVTFDDTRVVSSGRIATGQRFEAILTVTGSFTYRCVIHPSMTGTVEVVSAPAAPGTTATVAPAQGDGEGSSGGPVILVLAGVGLVAAAAVAWLLLRRRRTAAAGTAEP